MIIGHRDSLSLPILSCYHPGPADLHKWSKDHNVFISSCLQIVWENSRHFFWQHCHYPDLGSDASSVWNFCTRFLRHHLAWKPAVASPNVVGTSYMIIIMYLNIPIIIVLYTTPYIPLINTIYSYTSPYTPIHTIYPYVPLCNTIYPYIPLYNAIYPYIPLYNTIYPHIPLFITIDPYTSPYTSIHNHTPLYITIHPYTFPYTTIHHHTPLHITIHPQYTSPYTPIHHHTPLYITIHPHT